MIFILFRHTHSCARIHSDATGLQFSIIAASGYNNEAFLSSVEILDQGATSWRNGPKLPTNVLAGAMVEDPLGDVFKFSVIFFSC